MSDLIHVGRSAKNIKDSPLFYPFSGVKLIAGKDGDGNAVVYRAGNDSGRVLEMENPWGSQQMADDVFQRIRGYEYKPYRASGAMMNPAAELGDVVTVGDVYSVLDSVDTVFSPLMSSEIAARESGVLEHEYPYDSKSNRETAREISGIRTQFIVEMGRIETLIDDLDRGFSSRITQLSDSIMSEVTARIDADNNLSSRITQNAESITSEVTRATAAEGNLSSRITQNAESITSEIAARTAAESNLSTRITQNAESISSEVSRATAAEGNLGSRITQTASSIDAKVNGIYAPEWSTSGSNDGWYYPNDVVKITTYDSSNNVSDITYYKCKGDWNWWTEEYEPIRANNTHKPPNTSYWEVVDGPSVQSMFNIGLDGITLGYQSSDLNNSAVITINRGGIQMDAQTITMTNVVADTVAANTSISSPIISSYDETIYFKMVDSDYWGYNGGITLYTLIGEYEFPLLNVAYGDVGTVSLSGADHAFLDVTSSAANPLGSWYFNSAYVYNVTAKGTWDFSGATVTGLPSSSS